MYENAGILKETEAVLGAVAGDRTFKLGYEDFFLAEREAQRARLRAMWSFLGLEPPQDQARLEAFLVPGDVQMGGAATYGQLPNLAEIEATLGNDVTGHITYLAGATPQIVGRNHLRGDQ